MTFLWATRGRSWGTRFLARAGFSDPLVEYDKAFLDADEDPQICRRIEDRVAVRFTDPEYREDQSGREIIHEFVLFGDLADQVHTVADGLDIVWPLVADVYARIWDLPDPPALDD